MYKLEVYVKRISQVLSYNFDTTMCNRKFMLISLAFIVAVCHQAPTVSGGNILALFPHYGYSHFKVFFPLLRTLAERGHHVTVVTHLKAPADKSHPNYEELLLGGKETVNIVTFDFIIAKRSLPILLFESHLLHAEGQRSCNIFYESDHIQEVLKRHKSKPYDLVITEYFNTDCQMGIPYLLQVPVVGLSSCALMPYYYDRIALPDFPSYVQSEFIGFPETLNWHQRLVNFVQMKLLKIIYRLRTGYHDRQLIKKYLHIDVDLEEYARRSTSLILVNQHYSLSGIRPHTPQLIEMGGIHVEESAINATLPAEITRFLASAPPEGVFFLSWGSMIRACSLPDDKLQAIISVLKRQPFKVIWKWESDEKPIDDEKFLFVKWAPQLALLCHPKVRYFWGHGGLLGTTEAVHCAKPLIVTPMYGDQFLNGHAVSNRNAGLLLHYNDITEQNLMATMKELQRKSYAENAVALSHIFRNREQKPLDKSVWWVEHLLQQHGRMAHRVLHTKAVLLNWFVYHSLDSILILVLGTLAIGLLLRFLWRLVRAARGRKSAQKLKTN